MHSSPAEGKSSSPILQKLSTKKNTTIMNIIINRSEHDYLQKRVLHSFVIGSHLYGTNTLNSDLDYLCLYTTSDTELHSGLPNFHQFQYKDTKNKIDWNYCSELQFWKNLQSGDATINTDIILFTDFKENKLEICRTYKIIRAYLGFAKRDLKQLNKDRIKKMIHAERSLYCAEKLIDNKMPVLEDIQSIYKDQKTKEELICKEALLRNQVNVLYESGEIQNYYIKNCETTLWQKLLDSNNTREFRY